MLAPVNTSLPLTHAMQELQEALLALCDARISDDLVLICRHSM